MGHGREGRQGDKRMLEQVGKGGGVILNGERGEERQNNLAFSEKSQAISVL